MAAVPALPYATPLLEHVASLPASSFGPAMTACPLHLRAYVVARVSFGSNSQEAARAAGSQCKTDAALSVVASRWAHDPRVQAAIREELDKLFVDRAPAMAAVLDGIARSPKARNADRIKAATAVLDRAGVAPVRTLEVKHTGTVDHRGVPTMAALLAEAGLGPVPAEPIDAEWEAIPPEAVVDLAASAPAVRVALDERAEDWAEAQDQEAADRAAELAEAEADRWSVVK